MIESSNTQEPVESTGADAASDAETTQVLETSEPTNDLAPSEAPEKEMSLKEKIMAKRQEEKAAKAEAKAAKAEAAPTETPEVVPTTPETPKYEANFKYKAFGKEKELDDFWKPLVKDAESEKKVKELFTRADAFDDMKSRYENASFENQKVLQQYTALDRDVRRVTNFLNKGDLDNFFASVRISDDMLLQHLQRKAEIAKLSPMQQQAYEQDVQQRAEYYNQQESYQQLQQNYANQAALTRTMQLDMVLSRPEVNQAASQWDSKMGLGAFRQLVIDEAAKHYMLTKQSGQPEDLPAENAVNMVLTKFGKLFEQQATQAPVVQSPAPAQAAQPAAPQAPQTVVVQGKPVIPNVQGRGTSPVKQAPKSLADLKKLAKAARDAETFENA